MDHVTCGFLPLTDSAILVAACEKGFARAQDIDLVLVRETSWASIRDRMAFGHFDVAHMLAPMPIADTLGLTPVKVSMIAPMALGLGGNAVTVNTDLWAEMRDADAGSGIEPRMAGEALRKVIASRQAKGRQKLSFAVVHPHSGHNFELRYWLAACGVDPRRDIEIVIVPPPLMAQALAQGRTDGFCVGEPWNSVAVANGDGRIATVKAAIWKSSPEKVLGVKAEWAMRNPETSGRLLRALYEAARWCGDADNHGELADILARPAYLDQSAQVIGRALSGKLALEVDMVADISDFFIPFDRAATFPWQSHALWFYSQMVRWGQVEHTPANATAAAASYRPDLYRAALAPLGVPLPGASAKVEGALSGPTPVGAVSGKLVLGPDGFFDQTRFDPDEIDAYIASQSLHHGVPN
jgi:two-component system, oxyanion-binding sensor